MSILSSRLSHTGLLSSHASTPQVTASPVSMEIVPLANKSTIEKKASVYAEIVRNLNDARGRGLQYNVSLSLLYLRSQYVAGRLLLLILGTDI